MARCLVTACRVIEASSHSSPSVWPSRARRVSSNWRRVGSASALNTASMLMALLCNLLVACQAADRFGIQQKPLPAGLSHLTTTHPFLLSPRGEEGTHCVSDGKVRGNCRRRVCFRKQRESGASPPPSPSLGPGPPPPPLRRGATGASAEAPNPAPKA